MLDKGFCPDNALDSTQLTSFYLQKLVTVDAWGNGYHYDRTTDDAHDEYSVTSYGKNKTADTPTAGQTEYDVSVLGDFDNDIIYSNGVSLIHWALGFGIFFVVYPDVERARKEEQVYIDKFGTEIFESQNIFKISCQ